MNYKNCLKLSLIAVFFAAVSKIFFLGSFYSQKIYVSTPARSVSFLRASITSNLSFRASTVVNKERNDHFKSISALESSLVKKVKVSRSFITKKIVKRKLISNSKNVERVSYQKFEINNSDLIELGQIKTKKFEQSISWSNWFSSMKLEQKLAEIEEPKSLDIDKVIEDKVDMRLAAAIVDTQEVPKLDLEEEKFINELVNNITTSQIEKIKKKAIKSTSSKKKDVVDEEMIFFDYSEGESKEDKEIQKISKTVLSKLNNDMKSFNVTTTNSVVDDEDVTTQKDNKKVPFVPSHKILEQEKEAPVRSAMTSQGRGLDLSSQNEMLNLLNSKNEDENLGTIEADNHVGISLISTLEVDLTRKKTQRGIGYEFIPHYNSNERYSDNDGILTIKEKLNSSHGIMRGTIVKRGIVATNVDVVLEDGEFELEVPLLTTRSLDDLLTKHSISAFGGFILVDLHDEVDAVDIDAKYEDKFYFSENFREVGLDGDYRYILFAGVEPGNTLLQYVTFKNEEAEKIIHVTEDEIYFEANFFKKASNERIELYENKVLGSKLTELNIESEKLRYFNTNIDSKGLSINAYEISRPLIPIGTRKYYELSHLEDSIFIGNWDNRKVEVPSSEFISYVLDAQGYNSLDNRCMIQINYSKMIVDVQTFGQTMKGPMNVEMIHLDNDGMFGEYDEPTDLTKKSFIFGDFEGVVSLKVKYVDNSVDYLQTYCSNSTYLVEQL